MAPMLWSGAGQVITSLCESQASQHDVAIVTAVRTADQSDWPAYRARLRKARIPHSRIDFFHRDAETFWRGVEMLRTLVDRWRPDIVHTHAGVPACAAAAVRQGGRDFALVSHVHSWGPGRPEWMDLMDLAGLRQADVVVCAADAYAKRLVDGGVHPQRLVRLLWGLAPASLAGAIPRRVRRPGEFRIGLLGRIEPRKEQLALVTGFALVHRRLPGATLTLAGPIADQDYAQRVHDEIRRLRLGDVVRMPGHVRNAAAVVSGWDLCASLSSDEGQGLAILEAMALGVPVAARSVAGVEDYFRPGVNGFAVRSTRPRDIAEALVAALEDERQRKAVARRGRTEVLRRFSWDRTVRAVDRIYDRVSR